MCDDGWDLDDAHVVCQQLGYPSAVGAFHFASFGQGTGPTWLDEVDCTGSETNLTQCSHNGFGNEDCSHFEDAGVRCATEGRYSIMLIYTNHLSTYVCMYMCTWPRCPLELAYSKTDLWTWTTACLLGAAGISSSYGTVYILYYRLYSFCCTLNGICLCVLKWSKWSNVHSMGFSYDF